MYVELLSLLTAICFGFSAILTRWGMRDSNPITGAMVGSLVQVLALSVIIAVNPPGELNLMGVAYFACSGLFASALGRLLNYTSIQRLGVSMSSTIIGSSPLFSTIFAAIFLAEEVTLSVFAGTVLVVGGVAITSLKDGNVRELLSTAILTPILAAAAYGASALIGTNPLFALLLSLIFLRDTERLNTRIVLGCLSIVAGATVITLF